MKINRRRALLGGLGAMLGGLALGGRPAAAQDITFFRIGTGGTAGTYFPIGGLIANAISNPPGSRTCADGGSCGVPGLVATAVASNGSVANVAGIANGSMQSGFVQSDVAYWALNGTGIYEGRPKVDVLRAIANLYPESFHLVARKGAGIKSMKDLKGKRDVARRAGLGDAGRCAHHSRRLRHDRKGHQGRVPEAAAIGRQVQGRRARRLLQRRRLARGRHRRTRRDDRHRPRADRRAGSREADQAVQLLRRRRDSRTAPTRTSPA